MQVSDEKMAPYFMPTIAHHFGGGVYAKETLVPAGMVLVQHKHAHDHLSVLASGRVEVVVNGVRTEHQGPACLMIKAGEYHGIKALTDVAWYCIHATDCTNESDVDTVVIAKDSSTSEAKEIADSL